MALHLIRSSTIVLALIISGSISCSTVASDEAHRHDHAHEAGGLELGISAGYVDLAEDNGAFGIHLHAARRLGDEGLGKGIAIGPATELIFGEHQHYTALLPLTIFPWRGLALAVGPGIEWAEHESEWESSYATHLEVGYMFEIDKYDVGPTIGYSASGEDHYYIGVHVGIHL